MAVTPDAALRAALVLALAIWTAGPHAAATPLDPANNPVVRVKAKYREQLRAMGEEMVRRYEALEELMDPQICGCSYHVCGSDFPGGQCLYIPRDGTVNSLPTWFQPFFNCGLLGPCSYHKTYMDDSVIWTPSHVITEDPTLSQDVVEDICMTKGLEDTMKAVVNYTSGFTWPLYFAHARSGVLRQWPLVPQIRAGGVCKQFDPRDKQWYKVATSDPKNVVIIVETSNTMETKLFPGAAADSKSRWDVANQTVRGILETLDRISDSVNIVVFNATAAPLIGDTLINANRMGLRALTYGLDNTTRGKWSDNRLAFETAFDLFEKTFEREKKFQASCQNIIIHIGDGIDCAGSGQQPCSSHDPGDGEGGGGSSHNGFQNILEAVEKRQKKLELISGRAAIFTLTMRGGEDSLARQLACANGGVWFMLDGRGEPLNNMAAYFQYLAFSMESHTANPNGPAIFSPLILDFISIRDATTVVHPVFVKPKCANGTSSKRKVLLGVAGRVVTLRMLEEDGLTEAQVKVMINENLAEVRSCNEVYKYSNCKMQAIRGTSAECPARSWNSAATTKCYRFGSKHYTLHATPTDFEVAQEMCKDLGGRLAELGNGSKEDADLVKDEQHFLASIAPPDGAWIGMQPDGDGWRWTGSLREVPSSFRSRLWLKEPRKNTKCRGGFIDARGTMHNVGSRRCQENTAFICEFNASIAQLQGTCEGGFEEVSVDVLASGTAEGCGVSEGCGMEEPARPRAVLEPICDPGTPKVFTDLACCSQDFYKSVCPQQVNGNGIRLTQGVEVSKTDKGRRTTKTLVVLLVVVSGLIAVVLLLLSMHKKTKRALWTWVKVHMLRWQEPDARGASVELPRPPALSQPPIQPPGGAARKDPEPELDLSGASETPLPPILDIQGALPLEGGWEMFGAHGNVREGVWLDENGRAHKVAIKSARLLSSSNCVDAITKEFEILAALPRHPNIVWVIGARLGDNPIIVEELMATNLESAMAGDAPGLTYRQILGIGLDVAKGMDHLHRHHVTHYDIKPSNILLDKDGRAKLADFTCSKMKMATTISGMACGTLGYIAPEILTDGIQEAQPGGAGPSAHPPGDKIDIYSFGKVILECVTGRLDSRDEAAEELCPSAVWELIQWCVNRNPKDRPNSGQMVERLEKMVDRGGAEWLGRKPREDIWMEG